MAYHIETSEALYFEDDDNSDERLFFDEANRSMLVAKRDMDVRVVPVDGGQTFKMRIGNRGTILGLKLSLDKAALAVQRSLKAIDIVNVTTNTVLNLPCKASKIDAKILGFFWTAPTEIILVTNYGIEIFQVSLEKSTSSKLIKSFSLGVNWFVYSHDTKVLLLSSGPSGNTLFPFYFKDGVTRLPKFEITLPPISADPVLNKQQKLSVKDISLVLLYNRIYCVYIAENPNATEIELHMLTRETVTKRYVLQLNSKGEFAINILDNLMVVHSMASKLTMIFDVKSVANPNPVVSPLPLGPMYVKAKQMQTPEGRVEVGVDDNVAYGRDWVVFYPDLIVSPQLGCLWTVSMNLENIMGSFTDKTALLNFLLRRKNSRSLILQFIKSSLEKRTNPLVMSRLFDQLNAVCSSLALEKAYDKAVAALKEKERKAANNSFLAEYLGLNSNTFSSSAPGSPIRGSPVSSPADSLTDLRSSERIPRDSPRSSENRASGRPLSAVSFEEMASKGREMVSPKGLAVIDQESMYSWVFCNMEESKSLPFRYTLSILMEYLKSLNQYHLPVNHYIYELVINLLVSNQRFYQLHQFLQYHVVRDSVHVACLLLSLESKYPPAFQLAIDMLKRLETGDQLVEVLLLKKQVMTGLRFMRSDPSIKTSAADFLQAALETGDNMIFFNVYKFFEERNISQTGRPDFPPADGCEKYVEHYKRLYTREGQ